MILRQKVILLTGLAFMAFVIMLPPFSRPEVYRTNADTEPLTAFVPERNVTLGQRFLGFYFIVSGPPSPEGIEGPDSHIYMNVWLVEMLVVFIFTIYGIYLARNRSDEADRKHGPINEEELTKPSPGGIQNV